MSYNYDMIIIGGGIGGSAAALRAVQYNRKVCWIYGNRQTSKASRSAYVYNIDNMIGIHDRIILDQVCDLLSSPKDEPARERLAAAHFHVSGSEILRNTRNRIQNEYPELIRIIDARAESVRKENGLFTLSLDDEEISAPYLVLSTGVMDRQPVIRKKRHGKLLDGIHWIYPFANRETVLYCIRCQGHLTRHDKVAVIGSGESAAQVSLMLHERYDIPVFLLTNGEPLDVSEDSRKLIERYGIGVHESPIVDVVGEDKAKWELRSIDLEDGTSLQAHFALVSLGIYRVYNELAVSLGADLGDERKPTGESHVLVNQKSETSVPNLFAVGDIAKRSDEIVMKQIYTAQEYAVRAIDTIDYRIRKAQREKILAAS